MNVLKICVATLVASFATFTAASAVPCSATKTIDANKVLVADALDAFFNERNASAVDTYIGTEYLQHNPSVKDGPGELKAFIGMFNSSSKFELGAQAAEGDLVWTHGRYTGIPGLPTMIIVDIFRMKDGKAVEHWDIAQQEVPVAQTASGRPMFPIMPSATPVPVIRGCGDASASTPTCESKETLEANKKLAANALDAFFNRRDVSAVDKYVGGEYLQHNPAVPDGAEDLKVFISTFNSTSKFELGVQVAEADLVWTHGRYTDIPGLPVMIIVDVFRVKNGKLVEHWDIAQQEVPVSQTASGRPMFPIEA